MLSLCNKIYDKMIKKLRQGRTLIIKYSCKNKADIDMRGEMVDATESVKTDRTTTYFV